MFSVLASAGAAFLAIGVSTGIPVPSPGPLVPYTPLPVAVLAAGLDRSTALVGDTVTLTMYASNPEGDAISGTLTVTERVAGTPDSVVFTGTPFNFWYGSNEDRSIALPVTHSGAVSLIITVTPDSPPLLLGTSKTVSYAAAARVTAAATPVPGATKNGSSGGSASSPVGATTPSSAQTPTALPSSSTPTQVPSAADREDVRTSSSSDGRSSGDQTVWIVLIVCLTVLLLAGGAVLVLFRRRA